MSSEESGSEVGEGRAIGRVSMSVSGIDQIAAFLSALDSFIGAAAVADPQANRARLVCEELVANAFSHGPAERTGGVMCELWMSGRAVAGSVSYIGPAFDPTSQRPGGAESGRVGGQGLRIVQAVTNRLRFRHDGETCRVDFEILGE